MEKLFSLLMKLSSPRIPVPLDKQAHFISGAILGAVLTPFIGWWSVLVVSLIAMGKEIYDFLHRNNHTPDIWDWVATTLGGLFGCLLFSVI